MQGLMVAYGSLTFRNLPKSSQKLAKLENYYHDHSFLPFTCDNFHLSTTKGGKSATREGNFCALCTPSVHIKEVPLSLSICGVLEIASPIVHAN